MSKVVVGVNRMLIDGESPAGPDDRPDEGATIQQHWVEVGGKRITVGEDGLMSVNYGPDEPGGVNVVTIVVAPSSFHTVDYQTENR